MRQRDFFSVHKNNRSSGVLNYYLTRKKSINLLFLTAILTLGMSGCAIHQDANNRTIYSMDPAAVFGTHHARFNLQDGSEGSLRSIGDDYSIRLSKISKVIPLGKAQQMQLHQAYQIKDRTVLVINIQDTSGCMSTAVLAIRDSQVLHWVVTPSDCKSIPTVTANAEQLQLIYPNSRYLYANDILVEEKPREVSAPKSQSRGKSTRSAKPQNTSTARPATRSASRSGTANSTASKTPPVLLFGPSTEEQKPVIINLE